MPYFNERNEFIAIYSITTVFTISKSQVRNFAHVRRLKETANVPADISANDSLPTWSRDMTSNNRQRYPSTDYTEDYVFGIILFLSAYKVQIRLCERYNGSTLQSCCTRLLADFSNISTMPVQSRDSRSSFSNGWRDEQTVLTTVSTRRMSLTKLSDIDDDRWTLDSLRCKAQIYIIDAYKSSAVAEMGDRLATIDMGRKVGAAVSLSVGGAGSPSNTMSPGPRHTSVRSGIVIHPTVWPQYTNVTDRQNRQLSDS